MAGLGRNPRPGKLRSSSAASSSSCYYVTTLVFVALCIAGVWMLTSSSISPSQATIATPSTIRNFSSKKSSPKIVATRVTEEEEDDEDKKGADLAKDRETIGSSAGADGEEEERNERNQEEEEEAGVKEQESKVAGEEAQREHDEQLPTNEAEESQQEEVKQQTQTEEKIQQVTDENPQEQMEGKKEEEEKESRNAGDSLPEGGRSEMPNESNGKKRPWTTQADQSLNEEERREEEELPSGNAGGGLEENVENSSELDWKLCNVTAGTDYIPCLDNEKAIKKLDHKHFVHRERHCPEESPTCLVPLPKGYKRSIEWPKSREKIWYYNVPHTKLAEVKGHQNWVKVTGEHLTFPGGGTQFIHGALHYIDFIQQSVRGISWGKHTRVILDVGCGVASFGGYLFDRDVIAMSFAPKDEHEAQVQFALERGIPAISAVMGSQRLQFPSKVFDMVHCARCRVPWHADGGTLLLELNRVLRPGGFFVWSATPVYQKLEEDVEIWKAMTSLTKSMCWDLVTIKKDKLNGVGAAIYRKPTSNECYDTRKDQKPPMCNEDDDPDAAWYIPLKTCMHRLPTDASARSSKWPKEWPERLRVPPYWLNSSQIGIYGKPTPEDFRADYENWKHIVTKSYLGGFGINWSKVRNVMDMRAVYGGFAAALKDLKVWVMNVVNVDAPDTLPIIYERGLFGIYHDWCESFSTYPRTYDLLHADHLFSQIKERCTILPVVVEVDRILRPGGKLIVRDESATVSEVENLLKSLHWEVRLTFTKDKKGILYAEKSDWRPEQFADSS
ncbi:probable methyltransferase PMT27 isoform X1 [Typha angustifolia]|uniref:probable methyltransferase PMT27 isoform X1 n=2 Tax=Typha angustifolia TaxID=59011 RepID=UPI003C2EFD7A